MRHIALIILDKLTDRYKFKTVEFLVAIFLLANLRRTDRRLAYDLHAICEYLYLLFISLLIAHFFHIISLVEEWQPVDRV